MLTKDLTAIEMQTGPVRPTVAQLLADLQQAAVLTLTSRRATGDGELPSAYLCRLMSCHASTDVTIRLPEALPFQDYSSVAVAGQRIAVLSQESAALWLGTLRTSAWEVADEGRVCRFPEDAEGRTVYGNAEGVT